MTCSSRKSTLTPRAPAASRLDDSNTAMVLEFTSAETAVIPPEHREGVYEGRAVPPQAFVSVASYGSDRWTAFYPHHELHHNVGGVEIEGYVSSFTVLHLML